MSTQELPQILDELRAELQRVEPSDDTQRELLQRTIRDVEALLANSSADPGPEHHSLLERLREATRQFEKTHPTLTSAAGRVMDALANMGI